MSGDGGQRAGGARLLCLAVCCAHTYLGRRLDDVGHGGASSEVPATRTGVNNGCVEEVTFYRRVSAGDAPHRATSCKILILLYIVGICPLLVTIKDWTE